MRLRLRVLLPLALTIAAAPATAQSWQVVPSPGGGKVARVEPGGAIAAVELACDGKKLAMLVTLRAAVGAQLPLVVAVAEGNGPLSRPYGIKLPQVGAVNYAGVPPQRTLADYLSSNATRAIFQVGTTQTQVSLAGANAAMREALTACYVPVVQVAARNATLATGPAGRIQPIAQSLDGLPAPIARDLRDFDQSCAEVVDYWDGRGSRNRGTGTIAPDALQRADFNGDGVQDYLLDTRKLRCSRDEANTYTATLYLYTSSGDGSLRPTLDVDVDSFRIMPGAKAALRIHQNADDDPENEHGVVDETLTMISETGWSTSTIARPDWRLGTLSTYPPELQTLFRNWDESCTALGRRLTLTQGYGGEVIQDRYYVDESRTAAVDFNGDGKKDFVIDTDDIQCGVFANSPGKWPDPCGQNCKLIALLSKPDGSFAVDRIPRSITFNGNGDPAIMARFGQKTVICYFEPKNDGETGPQVRTGWTGITRQRTVLGENVGCDGKRF